MPLPFFFLQILLQKRLCVPEWIFCALPETKASDHCEAIVLHHLSQWHMLAQLMHSVDPYNVERTPIAPY